MALLRSRRPRRAAGVPAGLTLASLLPLGLMVGSYEVLEDDEALTGPVPATPAVPPASPNPPLQRAA